MLKLAVLVSGRGSNLEAIFQAIEQGRLDAQVAVVLSNKADALALAKAKARGITTLVHPTQDYPDRAAYDQRTMEFIDQEAPDLVVLAGFMRILTGAFVRYYAGRMINIHPSLLPSFPGMHTHARALAAGVRIHGATVHYVSEEVDAGPIIVQAAVPVLPNDTDTALAARVLAEEHRIYPMALQWIAEGRVQLDGNRVVYTYPTQEAQALIWPNSNR